MREESHAWREVTLAVVRPWRALNQPLHPRFIQVDDAFRSCGDQLPCTAIAQFVRLTPSVMPTAGSGHCRIGASSHGFDG